MTNHILIIITSVDSREQAEYICKTLLQAKLAACIQQTHGVSHYQWQGKLEVADEYYLHIKTSPARKQEVIAWLEQHHPYETPEIITLNAQASRKYSAWLHNETSIK